MRPPTLPSWASFVDRPHGTRLRYMAGCHCVPCRAANARYAAGRRLRRAQGRANGLVPVDDVVVHVRALSRARMGYKRVARLAGVNGSNLARMLDGSRRFCRLETARRILAVDVVHSRGTLRRSGPTRRKVRGLMLRGYQRRQLARLLGWSDLVVRRTWIATWRAVAIARLYRQLTAEAAPRGRGWRRRAGVIPSRSHAGRPADLTNGADFPIL